MTEEEKDFEMKVLNRENETLRNQFHEALEKARKWKAEAEKWQFAYDKLINSVLNHHE